jgi:hypothetical protein
MYGTLVVNEYVLQITRLQLRKGELWVEATTRATERMVLPHGSQFVIHGEDGSHILTGEFKNHGEDVKVAAGDYVSVIQPVGFQGKAVVGWPA